VHRLQWEHLNICIELVNKALQCADNEESRHSATIARGLLDRAEHSCQMWWASNRPMWDINLIHMGLLDQWRTVVNAYRAINKSGASEETKREYYRRAVAARDHNLSRFARELTLPPVQCTVSLSQRSGLNRASSLHQGRPIAVLEATYQVQRLAAD